jgi:hypothetical protein
MPRHGLHQICMHRHLQPTEESRDKQTRARDPAAPDPPLLECCSGAICMTGMTETMFSFIDGCSRSASFIKFMGAARLWSIKQSGCHIIARGS